MFNDLYAKKSYFSDIAYFLIFRCTIDQMIDILYD